MRFDKYQKYGVVILLVSLFLIFVWAHDGYEKILYLAGIVYSLIFIFHAPLERLLVAGVKRPVFWYGVAVVFMGLFVEVLAYYSNLGHIRAGRDVFLFGKTLTSDLLSSLPYYISYGLILAWAVKKYELSTFELVIIMGIAQASMTDMFTHFLPLFFGGIAGVVGFILAGLLMLFTLNAPYVLFENAIKDLYPNRNRTWLKYPIVMFVQLIPIPVTFIFKFLSSHFL